MAVVDGNSSNMVAEPGSTPGEANRADESNRTGSGNAGPYGMSQPPGFGSADASQTRVPTDDSISDPSFEHIEARRGGKDRTRPWLDHLR